MSSPTSVAHFHPTPTMSRPRSYVNYNGEVYDLYRTCNTIHGLYVGYQITEGKRDIIMRIMDYLRFTVEPDYHVPIAHPFLPQFQSASIWFAEHGVRFNFNELLEGIDWDDMSGMTDIEEFEDGSEENPVDLTEE